VSVAAVSNRHAIPKKYRGLADAIRRHEKSGTGFPMPLFDESKRTAVQIS
jgi:hypothetical protein